MIQEPREHVFDMAALTPDYTEYIEGAELTKGRKSPTFVTTVRSSKRKTRPRVRSQENNIPEKCSEALSPMLFRKS